MNLAERKEEIFGVAEPHLAVIARRFNLHDPQGEAKSWFFRFQKIIQGFDEGRYEKRYKDAAGNVHELPEDPSEEQVAFFYRSLVAYLKTAFRNDLRADYRKKKRVHLVSDYETDVKPSTASVQESLNTMIHSSSDVIGLKDMLSILEEDVVREGRLATVARDRLNVLFLKAVSIFYKKMFEQYGDFSIVRDLNAKDSRDFFIYDIREGRTESIGAELSTLLKDEPLRAVVLQSTKLLKEGSGYYALNRKISRYFNDEHGGMAARLKKAKC